MIPLCLNCIKRPAQHIEPIGYTYCKPCIMRQKAYVVRDTIETIPESIKEDRKIYAKDILQKFKGDTPSLEYIKEYGATGFNKEELKRARNVNQSDSFYVDKNERYK